MKDIKEFLYGKRYKDNHNKFMDALNEIEEKNDDFFKDRKSKYDPNKQDRLHNHYGIINRFGRITFGINEDSDLPSYIINDCLNAFNSIWNNNEKINR